MMSAEADDYCFYGCLTCLAKFGPYINRKILLPHVASINAGLRRRLEGTNSIDTGRSQTMMDIDNQSS